MEPDLTSIGSEREDEPAIVAAVDEIDGNAHVVIADTSRDDVWLTMPERATCSLDDWR